MERSLHQLAIFFNNISQGKDIFIIAVDGPGGAGKSFFVDQLSRFLDNYDMVHFDDFYLPESNPERIGSNFDWKRLKKEVLLPYKRYRKCTYQIYNWITNSLENWKEIKDKKYLFIEGVTSARLELRKYLDFIIFVETPYEIRLKRGIDRDGEKTGQKWVNDWVPRENKYFNSSIHNTRTISDLVIDGTYFKMDKIKIVSEKNSTSANK
jgi:uridine kinase